MSEPLIDRYFTLAVDPDLDARFADEADVEIRGDFPGSPVALAVAFVVDGGTIRELTIRPADEF